MSYVPNLTLSFYHQTNVKDPDLMILQYSCFIPYHSAKVLDRKDETWNGKSWNRCTYSQRYIIMTQRNDIILRADYQCVRRETGKIIILTNTSREECNAAEIDLFFHNDIKITAHSVSIVNNTDHWIMHLDNVLLSIKHISPGDIGW